jgi:hypothetical protein
MQLHQPPRIRSRPTGARCESSLYRTIQHRQGEAESWHAPNQHTAVIRLSSSQHRSAQLQQFAAAAAASCTSAHIILTEGAGVRLCKRRLKLCMPVARASQRAPVCTAPPVNGSVLPLLLVPLSPVCPLSRSDSDTNSSQQKVDEHYDDDHHFVEKGLRSTASMFASIPASGASMIHGLFGAAPGHEFVRLPTHQEISMSGSAENVGGVCAALTRKLASSSLSYSPSLVHMVRQTQAYLCWHQSVLPLAREATVPLIVTC